MSTCWCTIDKTFCLVVFTLMLYFFQRELMQEWVGNTKWPAMHSHRPTHMITIIGCNAVFQIIRTLLAEGQFLCHCSETVFCHVFRSLLTSALHCTTNLFWKCLFSIIIVSDTSMPYYECAHYHHYHHIPNSSFHTCSYVQFYAGSVFVSWAGLGPRI